MSLTNDNIFCIFASQVAFTLGQNTPRKMVVLLVKKIFFIYQIAKSTAYYAAYYALCERAISHRRKQQTYKSRQI